MGLESSPGAFSGAYSAFHRFRQASTTTCGGSYPPHMGKTLDGEELDDDYWYLPDPYTRESHPGLFLFLEHSDCDGEISPEDCAHVVKDLTPLVGKVGTGGGGHIDRDGGYRKVLEKFIDGCLLAIKNNEPLEFY